MLPRHRPIVGSYGYWSYWSFHEQSTAATNVACPGTQRRDEHRCVSLISSNPCGSLGIGLLQGPTRGVFLMSKVPLFMHTPGSALPHALVGVRTGVPRS